jgi:DNA polymerase-1
MNKTHEEFVTYCADKSPVFLLDTSWHLYRSHFVYPTLTTHIQEEERPSGHVYGVVKVITDIKHFFPSAVIVLVEEKKEGDGKLAWRKALLPEYKEGRTALEYNIFGDLNDIYTIAMLFPDVYVASSPGMEADDILYSLAKQLERQTSPVYIYSGDNDLLQAVTERIHVVKGIIDGGLDIYDSARVMEKFGVTPQNLPLYRAVTGDSSDKIPGLLRFPRKILTDILSSASTIDEMIQVEREYWTAANRKQAHRIQEDRSIVERNLLLMQLSEIPCTISRIDEGNWEGRGVAAIQRWHLYSAEIRYFRDKPNGYEYEF